MNFVDFYNEMFNFYLRQSYIWYFKRILDNFGVLLKMSDLEQRNITCVYVSLLG